MALQDIVKKGSTDRSVTVRIIDSTDGTPETAVAYNTSGIDLWYRREGAALVSITEATLAALTTAHADGGFLAIGNGEYRLDLPDAAFATGANYVDYGGTVTGMIVIGGRVRLVDFDLEVAGPSATSVNNLLLGIIFGTAATGTLSTTQCTSSLTGYANDDLIGRRIVFTGGTADGCASFVTDYASASGLLTFSPAIATTPANGDAFKLV